MNAIAGNVCHWTVIQGRLPAGVTSGIGFAIEKVEIVLADEEVSAINRIGTNEGLGSAPTRKCRGGRRAPAQDIMRQAVSENYCLAAFLHVKSSMVQGD